MDETELFETDEAVSISDKSASDDTDNKVGRIVSYVQGRFRSAEDARRNDEERWLDAYRNYRGVYSSDMQFTDSEKSRIFIRVTKTKALAAYGQIIDVLFANNRFPLSVDPTTLPEGVAESVHFDAETEDEEAVDALKQAFNKPAPFTNEESRLRPGETLAALTERLGGMKT